VNRGRYLVVTRVIHRCKDSVRHHNVTVDGDQYTFGLASFDSLNEFLEHFDKQPIVAGQSGEKLLFLCHYQDVIFYCFVVTDLILLVM